MKKLTKILVAGILSISVANANSTLQKSMDTMQKGIEKVQYGFINNDISSIKDGLKEIKTGNTLFAKDPTSFLPKNRKHMGNIATNAITRINLDTNIIELNLDDKAYIKAADGYADMINACSRCHGLVRNW